MLMDEIILRLKKHYWPVIFLVIIAWLIFYFTWTNKDNITFIARTTGYISIILLAVSLIIGPANVIMNYRNPASAYLRRDISITGGVLAVIHSITGLFVHLRGRSWEYFFHKTGNGYAIRVDSFGLANYSGLISTLIIILLIIISNEYFLKKMKPSNWKNIQRLSYLMFVLAIIHSIFYRIVKENLNHIFWLYIPLFIIVLTFQLTGLKITLNKKKNKI